MADYVSKLESGTDSEVREAQELEADGFDIDVAISGSSTVHISTEHKASRYEILFNIENDGYGWYEVSAGEFAGKGRILGVREISTPGFRHSYYILVQSDLNESYLWRVGLTHLSDLGDGDPQ